MPRSEKEFLDEYFHVLMGMACDGACLHRTGPELSIWIRMIQVKITALLRKIHAETTLPQNGLKKEKTL